MALIAHASAFSLICLTCTSYGHRTQTVPDEFEFTSFSQRALAAFLLASKPETGWQLLPTFTRESIKEATPVGLHASRRQFLQWASAGLLLPCAARAFDNRLPLPPPPSGGTPTPPKPGPPPKVIGVQKQTGKLMPCMDTKPHCLSTSSIIEFDEDAYDEDIGDPGLMKPWKFTKNRDEAMADLMTAIKAYPPGQNDIDGGGWKIIKEKPDYVYVQYESFKKGFIDDMEFAMVRDGELSLRTSSRLGFKDSLVNSKRVNYFAEALGALPGWTTKPVTKETNSIYWDANTQEQSRLMDMRRLRGDVYVSEDGIKNY